jgi:anti-anti-sigma factor
MFTPVSPWGWQRMEITTKKIDEQAVVELSGKLDMVTCPALRKAAAMLIIKGKCKSLTIDFSKVPLIDTSGLATLLEILVMAEERSGRLVLVGLNGRLRYLIEVNGLTAFFRIADPVQEKADA